MKPKFSRDLPAVGWPTPGTPPGAWLETGVITALLPVIGYLFNHDDPFLRGAEFSWLIFAPMLAALRYGFAHGFLSALVLALGIALHWYVGDTGLHDFPTAAILGLILCGMLTGAWTDWWVRRLAQARVENAYHHQRLEEFTSAYHLLRISHDRLSQRVAASTDSLRDTLQRLHNYLQQSEHPHLPLRGMARDILALFSNFTWVQVAALYVVDERGELQHPPEAMLGEPTSVDERNPLVAAALAQREMVAATAADDRDSTGGQLACAPISTSDGRVQALLVVERMPFMNFTQENLRLLAVLATHVGHLLSRADASGDAGSGEFGRHLQRALDDLRHFALPATLVSLRCPVGRRGEELAEFAQAQSRGLDRPWQTLNRRGEVVLCLLMPLTSEAEAMRYVERLQIALGKRVGGSSLAEIAQRASGNTLDALGVRVSVRGLSRDDGVSDLLKQLSMEHNLEPGRTTDTGGALR